MSGIAGCLRFDGGPPETVAVRTMADMMQHRGPDGITVWSDANVSLAQLMLRTTAETTSADLPLHCPDRSLSLVMDGRVDNWEDLRRQLTQMGVHLRSQSDAELVLSAFSCWGPACLSRIEGDFAFVLWDARARQAFCARDRMGQKPFYYHWDGRRFVFASELRPVFDALSETPGMNEGIVAEMLDNSWISRDETMWHGILRLAPGHAMTVDANGVQRTRYWQPETVPLLRHKSDADYAAHYRDTMMDVVRRVSRSHLPVGYDVSGGLDSSSIFAAADALTTTSRLPAPDILGFTMLFDVETDAYELDYAHAVGAHRRRSITEIPPTLAPLYWYLEESAHRMTIANMPNVLMHQGTYRGLQKRGGRAYLSGLGGDQWLAFGDAALAEAFQLGSWSMARDVLRSDLAEFGVWNSVWRTLRHGAYPLLPEAVRAHARRISPVRPEGHEPETWLSDRLQDILSERRDRAQNAWRNKTKGLRVGLRQRLMAVESAYLQFGCELLDVTGQQAGVEIRSPFLNQTFLEFCLSLPLTQLRRGDTDRYIHRQAMVDLLPTKVLERTDKAEFSAASAPVRDELVALSAPKTSDWVSEDDFKDVQESALDAYQTQYSWPEGMLLFYVLLSGLKQVGTSNCLTTHTPSIGDDKYQKKVATEPLA